MKDDQQQHNSKRQQPGTKSEQDEHQQQQTVTKRQKVASDDLICVITHELPFDPVTAEDGRLYERAAIEQHISQRQKQGLALKSPITNETMGPRLFAMPQIKSLIETMIENRSITGDLVNAWKKKEEDRKCADQLLKKAQDGDARSMYRLYILYITGKGLKKDGSLAFHWVKKSHEAGSVYATAVLGKILLRGSIDGENAVPKNTSDGLVLTSLAAQKGSDVAAANLGWAFAYGKYGLTVNTAQAIFWLQSALCDNKCPFKDLRRKSREHCRMELEKLIEKQGSDMK